MMTAERGITVFFNLGPIYTCCSVNDSYLPKALELVQSIASAGSCDTAAMWSLRGNYSHQSHVCKRCLCLPLMGWCVHVELLKNHFSDCVNSCECPLESETTSWEVREHFGTRVAELTSYVAETRRTKANTGLVVRNFYQKTCIVSFPLLFLFTEM